MKKNLLLIFFTALCLHSGAQLTVSRQQCNYQTGTAVVNEQARVGWQLTSNMQNDRQTAYQITVTERITNKKVYDSKRVSSSESQHIALPSLPFRQQGYLWRVRVWDQKGEASPWSSGQTIRMAPSMDEAKWIGAITKQQARIPDGRWSNGVFKKDTFKAKWDGVDTLSSKSIVLRKMFVVNGSVPADGNRRGVDAQLAICGLGHYVAYLNGHRVGSDEFAPLWSEYSHTTYYNIHDVTQLIRDGINELVVILGNGFYNVQRGNRYSKLQTSFGPPKLLARLDVLTRRKTATTVVTDESWELLPSPVTFNSIYGGESYDARRSTVDGNWRCRQYADEQKAVVVEAPEGHLRAQEAPPVRIMERYDVAREIAVSPDSLDAASAKTRRTVHPSVRVFDMGQNLAGFPEITVTGQPGQTVTLLVAESLTSQGVCDQSQTGRQHYYEYTLCGNPLGETWHPSFSYYGFRFIQVEGAVLEGEPNPDGLPVLYRLRSCFVHNSAPEVSSFQCSNDLFTRTHRLIERAERSNMQAVLTDCPHREKLGWLEQDHLCGPSLLYNYEMGAYIPKVIRDITDTQKANGMVPTTAPQYVSFGNLFDDSPEWGSTLVILPFMYYEHYGDSTLIVDNYDAMRRYVDYLSSRADDGIVSHGLGDWYDYGPWRAGFSRNTPVPLVATAHYIYDLQLLTRAAQMTGHDADAHRYSSLLNSVTDAFNRHFFHPDSCYYGTNSQTSNALPLFLNLVPTTIPPAPTPISSRSVNSGSAAVPTPRDAVLKNLIADIHSHGNRLTTGDVGNRYLFQTLARNDLNDLLYAMLNHYETPGYGYQLSQGATTLTEQWDPRQGSSQNHFMMGQIDEWLFRTLAGIGQQAGTVGMRHLEIDPHLVGDLQWVKASTETLYGRVAVHATKTSVTVDIPVGCDARVRVNGRWDDVGSGHWELE